jgi:hypothetical protein
MGTKKTENQTIENKKSVRVVKKVTVKDIFGTFNTDKIPEGKELALCRIAGIANGTTSGVSQYGPWHALTGDFAGTNKETGEISIASACIVPGAMGDALVNAVTSALKEDASASITFSVDVFAVVSQRDVKKYEYIVRPVIAGTKIENQAMALLTMES